MTPEIFNTCTQNILTGDLKAIEQLFDYFSAADLPKSDAEKIKNEQKKVALKIFTEHANKKNVGAMIFLAYFYLKGWAGVSKDFSKYVKLMSEAANNPHKNPIAQNGMGNRYSAGEGVKKDLKTAFQYYSASAAQNYPDGLYNLGWIYKNNPEATDKSGNAATQEGDRLIKLAAAAGSFRALHAIHHYGSNETWFNDSTLCPFRYYQPKNNGLRYKWIIASQTISSLGGTVSPQSYHMVVEYTGAALIPNSILADKIVSNYYNDILVELNYKYDSALYTPLSMVRFAKAMAEAIREADELLTQYLVAAEEREKKFITAAIQSSIITEPKPQPGTVTLTIERLKQLLLMAQSNTISIEDILTLAQKPAPTTQAPIGHGAMFTSSSSTSSDNKSPSSTRTPTLTPPGM